MICVDNLFDEITFDNYTFDQTCTPDIIIGGGGGLPPRHIRKLVNRWNISQPFHKELIDERLIITSIIKNITQTNEINNTILKQLSKNVNIRNSVLKELESKLDILNSHQVDYSDDIRIENVLNHKKLINIIKAL